MENIATTFTLNGLETKNAFSTIAAIYLKKFHPPDFSQRNQRIKAKKNYMIYLNSNLIETNCWNQKIMQTLINFQIFLFDPHC